MPTMTRPTLPAPDLREERVARIASGLRPCRRGGLRLETEQIGATTIVHNYGHGGCGVTLALGTAAHAADLAQRAGGDDAPIGVLGAGVVGLASARELAQRGRRVRIYADKIGLDTLSPLAGALWLPTGINLDDPEIGLDAFHALLRRSREILATLDAHRFGIEILPVYEPAHAPHEPRYFGASGIAPPTALDRLPLPGPPRAGRVFEAPFIHTPLFLAALLEDAQDAGAEIVERSFASIDDILALDERTLVNALALGSRDLFGDATMFPARGVLVHLEPEELGYCAHDGYRYMFPRRDALILGGSFDEGLLDGTNDASIARSILAHHRRFFGLV